MAPQAKKKEDKLELNMQTRVKGFGGQAKGTTFPTTTNDQEGETPTYQWPIVSHVQPTKSRPT